MKWRFVICLLVNLVCASLCAADFQVNTHTTYDQRDADLAMDADGSFLIVWASYLQDGSSNGIIGRYFDPNCSPIAGEFQINGTSSGNQAEPAVAMSAVGSVVTWHGPGATEQDAEDIFARRYDPNGLPLGDEFRVNSLTTDRQTHPDVAINHDGSFVVVWESSSLPAEGDRAVCGQLYDSNGVISGPEFVINAEASVCRHPSVAADIDGGFAITWLDDRSSNSIVGRLFDPNSLPSGEQFQINTVRFGSVTRPSIAMDSAGYFVVTWDGDPNLAAMDDVHVRVFEPNGAPLGGQFRVNTMIEGPQGHPQVTLNERAEFVIVWESVTDPNVNERDVFAQRFSNFGEPLGSEFLVGTIAEGNQRYPVAALGGDGRFVTAWQSYNQDGSRYGIFAETGRMVGSADFNSDGFVNLLDYRVLGDQWLEEGPALSADLVFDDRIDQEDLAEFSRQWLAPAD